MVGASLAQTAALSYSRRSHRHSARILPVVRAEAAHAKRPDCLRAHELATGICCASGGALWLEVEAPPMPNRCLHLAQTTVAGFDIRRCAILRLGHRHI